MTSGQEAAPARRGLLLLARAGAGAGPWLALMAVAALGLAVLETVLPAVLGHAVDALTGHGEGHVWVTRVVLLVGGLVALDAIDDVAGGTAAARSTAWLRRRLAHHVLELGPRATTRFGDGDLLGRLVGSAVQAGRAGPMVVRAIANLVPAFGAPVALALIDPLLCLAFLAGVPVLLVLVRTLTRDAHSSAESYLAAQGTIATRLVEALRGARTIAAAGTAEREAERILEPLDEMRRHGFGLWRAQMRMTAQDGLLTALLEVVVLGVGGLELAAGRLTPGELVAAGQYVILGATMTSVLSSVTGLARARAAAERIAAVLDEPLPAFGDDALADGPGRLELRGVSVKRDGRAVLRDVDLVIPAGALVALVGPSGSGKSLLAALPGRLAAPEEGAVLIDGVDVSSVARAELRRAVTYGFERPVLWGETIRDAIGLGPDRPGRGVVTQAARAADALRFIKRLPRGMRTPLPQAPMSGGELQRVGLARAFAHAGRLLVLDDVAASLDTSTEARISEVLERSFADRTRILVAHRASAAARADFVVWLEDGAVRDVGPHAELWRHDAYRRLFAEGAAHSVPDPVPAIPEGAAA